MFYEEPPYFYEEEIKNIFDETKTINDKYLSNFDNSRVFINYP